MATEISRTFDLEKGSVLVVIKDAFGKSSPHTIYVAGVDDVEATIASLIARSDAEAADIRAKMMAAGWSGIQG